MTWPTPRFQQACCKNTVLCLAWASLHKTTTRCASGVREEADPKAQNPERTHLPFQVAPAASLVMGEGTEAQSDSVTRLRAPCPKRRQSGRGPSVQRLAPNCFSTQPVWSVSGKGLPLEGEASHDVPSLEAELSSPETRTEAWGDWPKKLGGGRVAWETGRCAKP